jgi:hypothetical protein
VPVQLGFELSVVPTQLGLRAVACFASISRTRLFKIPVCNIHNIRRSG